MNESDKQDQDYKIGENYYRNGYMGEIIKLVPNGFLIKYWFNPRTGIGYKNHTIRY